MDAFPSPSRPARSSDVVVFISWPIAGMPPAPRRTRCWMAARARLWGTRQGGRAGRHGRPDRHPQTGPCPQHLPGARQLGRLAHRPRRARAPAAPDRRRPGPGHRRPHSRSLGCALVAGSRAAASRIPVCSSATSGQQWTRPAISAYSWSNAPNLERLGPWARTVCSAVSSPSSRRTSSATPG